MSLLRPEPGPLLRLDEASARRLLLAQAVEGADTQGRLVGATEREQVEQAALDASRDPAQSQAPDPARYLRERATRLLALVEGREPRIASLARADSWQPLAAWGLPALAFLLGAGLDRIDNPRQVNMLSPPLLAFLLWNVCVYLLLVLAPLWRRRGEGSARGPSAWLRRWLASGGAATRTPPRAGSLRPEVAARFRLRWWSVASALETWRVAQVMHAAAAAWAVGLGLSIVLGGVVREYRVGWESTLLDVGQVHAVLRVLFAPVLALLPMDGFSVADLERMHFRSGVEVARDEACRWIGLYLALLALVVVLPRSLLALYAASRKRWLARAVVLDTREPYFAEVLARVSPARVLVGVVQAGPRASAWLLAVLRQAGDAPGAEPPVGDAPWTVLATARGDELRVQRLAPEAAGPAGEAAGTGRGWRRWLHGTQAPAVAAAPASLTAPDVVLVAIDNPADVEAVAPLLRRLGVAAVLLGAGEPAQAHALRAAAEQLGLAADVLPLAECGRSWLQESRLRDALTRRLPATKLAGAHRLMGAWRAQHQARFEASMRLLAEPLLQAARESQPLNSSPLSLRRLVDPAQRDANAQARQDATAALLQRLSQAQSHAMAGLLRLHGADAAAASSLEQGLERGLVVRESVDAPQAGLAGVASGAAAGATVDLMTGGLTLGAAAALGGLLGGGAALAAAAWKNRSAPGGASSVQLNDEMLQALVELALLRYLAVIHHGRDALFSFIDTPAAWRSEVVAQVEASRAELGGLWVRVRGAADAREMLPGVAQALQGLAERVTARLGETPEVGEAAGRDPAG